MTASLIAPAAQICMFALGCALIHAARAHAAVVTQVLTGAAMVTAALALIASTMIYAPDDQAQLDEITVYAAIAHHPVSNH
jgi:hypothetical protein